MRAIFILTLCLLPFSTIDNRYFMYLVQQTWTYEYVLKTYQNEPLKRGENKQAKRKRIDRLKNKIEVLKYQQNGYKLNIKYL